MGLDKIVQLLVESKIEFVLVGGLAAYMRGSPVVTEDVDVCLRFTRENLDRLAAALKDLHPRHRLTANKLPFEITDQNWSMFKNIYVTTDWGVLDCLGEVLGVGNYDQCLRESEDVKFEFGSCRTLTLEALIRAKEAVGRPHDLRTVTYLRTLNGKKNQG